MFCKVLHHNNVLGNFHGLPFSTTRGPFSLKCFRWNQGDRVRLKYALWCCVLTEDIGIRNERFCTGAGIAQLIEFRWKIRVKLGSTYVSTRESAIL